MKFSVTQSLMLTTLIASVAVAGIAVAAPQVANSQVATNQVAPATQTRTTDPFWAQTEWDNDADDLRRYGALPRPSKSALRAIGVTRVLEVEWDDGQIEIEGLNAQGREVDVVMDRAGRQVLRSKVERWDD